MIFICEGKVTEKFQLFNADKKNLRNIHVVYSGGDDVFLVGAWDDLIELAVDIRRIFEQFTNDKLTFSAGIGFFQPKFPVSELARKTGILEDIAKNNPGKNSIALFGAPSVTKSKEINSAQSYSWKIFTEKVCGEKINFLLENFNFDTSVQVQDKLTLGKSGLYRILSFLANTNEELQSVNLARFAYLLARLNPGENKNGSKVYSKIRDQFYFWYKDLQERKELRTAVELIIYSMR
jgi:CRISPR-associated protein Csm1